MVSEHLILADRSIEVQRTVASVKERFNLSRETNGPEGTVSKKTQDSLTLRMLRKGMNRLIENITSINPSFIDLVELLTTQVENLHAVSHFKHKTFSAFNHSQDFGTIVKESLKRITSGLQSISHTTSRIIPCLIYPCLCQRSQLWLFQRYKEWQKKMKPLWKSGWRTIALLDNLAFKVKTLMCVPYNAHYWWRFCEFMWYIFILVRFNPQNWLTFWSKENLGYESIIIAVR